jgi:hypothetical protein
MAFKILQELVTGQILDGDLEFLTLSEAVNWLKQNTEEFQPDETVVLIDMDSRVAKFVKFEVTITVKVFEE